MFDDHTKADKMMRVVSYAYKYHNEEYDDEYIYTHNYSDDENQDNGTVPIRRKRQIKKKQRRKSNQKRNRKWKKWRPLAVKMWRNERFIYRKQEQQATMLQKRKKFEQKMSIYLLEGEQYCSYACI